jgi:hypothetical protein
MTTGAGRQGWRRERARDACLGLYGGGFVLGFVVRVTGERAAVMRDAVRELLRRTGVYFGIGTPSVADPALKVSAVRSHCVAIAGWHALLGAFTAVMMVGAFAGDLRDVVVYGALGAAIWGAVWFGADARRFVPWRPMLLAPRDAVIAHERRSWRRTALAVAWGAPFCVALAWAAGHWDALELIAPGQFFGMALAHGIAAALVARWERAHGRVVLFREAAGDTELYEARAADAV